MTSTEHSWRIRPLHSKFNPYTDYGTNNTSFVTIKVIHGGSFSNSQPRVYRRASIAFVDYVDVNLFRNEMFQEIIKELGYAERGFFYWKHPSEDFDYGLCSLEGPSDFENLHYHLYTSSFSIVVQIFAETGEPTVHNFYPNSLLQATPEKIGNILYQIVFKNPTATHQDAKIFILGLHGITLPDDLVKLGYWLANKEVRASKAEMAKLKWGRD